MMNANSHFGTLRYPLFMYTMFFYLRRSLLEQEIELVLNFVTSATLQLV